MTRYLADTSALEQRRYSDEAAEMLGHLMSENQLAICEIVALEVLYSSRSPSDYEKRWRSFASLTWLPVNEEVTQGALTLQRQLAQIGQHRRPIPDLLVAATALVHGATVLHYYKDFDLIAQVSEQPTRWILPRGTGHGQDS